MTESSGEETGIENSWIDKTYKHWLKHYLSDGLTSLDAERQALEQTLHKGNLMEIKDWDKDTTLGEIADYILKTVPEEVDWWLKKRYQSRFLEQIKNDVGFRRVFRVKSELIDRMQK